MGEIYRVKDILHMRWQLEEVHTHVRIHLLFAVDV